MKDQYVEAMVKRKSFQGVELIKKAMIVLMVITLLAGFSVLPWFLIITVILGTVYYFKISRVDSEFESYYMDGELEIAQIFNKSKRKNMMNIKEGEIVLVAPCDTLELKARIT